jgi:hypothetical protein
VERVPAAPENKKILVVETSLPTIRLSSVTFFIVPSNTNYDLSLSH